MFKIVTKPWGLFVCLLIGLGVVWCIGLSPQFYVRDMSTGLLLGPYRLKNGVIVETGTGGFCVTDPQPGELEVMDRLRSVTVDVHFCDQPLPEVVDILMAKQASQVPSERMIQIALRIDSEWSDSQSVFAYSSGNRWIESPRVLPTDAFAENNVSMLDVLRDIQSVVGYPLILKIDKAGAVLWLRFQPQSD